MQADWYTKINVVVGRPFLYLLFFFDKSFFPSLLYYDLHSTLRLLHFTILRRLHETLYILAVSERIVSQMSELIPPDWGEDSPSPNWDVDSLKREEEEDKENDRGFPLG